MLQKALQKVYQLILVTQQNTFSACLQCIYLIEDNDDHNLRCIHDNSNNDTFLMSYNFHNKYNIFSSIRCIILVI